MRFENEVENDQWQRVKKGIGRHETEDRKRKGTEKSG